jgi:hypothetical protein
MTSPKLSAPPPDLITKPGTTPADSHRIPDATHASSSGGVVTCLRTAQVAE